MTDSKSQVWTEDDVCERINEAIDYGLGREEQILNKIQRSDEKLFESVNNSDSVDIPDCITKDKIRSVLEHYSNNGKNQTKLARKIIQDLSIGRTASANSNEKRVMADGGVLNLSDPEKRVYYLSLSVINSFMVGLHVGGGKYIVAGVISIILAFVISMYLSNSKFKIDVGIED